MADRPPLPYDFLLKVPSFTVTSDDMADGQKLSEVQVYNGFGGREATRLPICAGRAPRRRRRATW